MFPIWKSVRFVPQVLRTSDESRAILVESFELENYFFRIYFLGLGECILLTNQKSSQVIKIDRLTSFTTLSSSLRLEFGWIINLSAEAIKLFFCCHHLLFVWPFRASFGAFETNCGAANRLRWLISINHWIRSTELNDKNRPRNKWDISFVSFYFWTRFEHRKKNFSESNKFLYFHQKSTFITWISWNFLKLKSYFVRIIFVQNRFYFGWTCAQQKSAIKVDWIYLRRWNERDDMSTVCRAIEFIDKKRFHRYRIVFGGKTADAIISYRMCRVM